MRSKTSETNTKILVDRWPQMGYDLFTVGGIECSKKIEQYITINFYSIFFYADQLHWKQVTVGTKTSNSLSESTGLHHQSVRICVVMNLT